MKKTAKKEQIKYKVASNAQNFETKILNLPFSLIISSFIHSFSCCSLTFLFIYLLTYSSFHLLSSNTTFLIKTNTVGNYLFVKDKAEVFVVD